MKKTIRWLALALALLCLIGFVAWVIWGNTALEVTFLKVESPRLPKSFDGFRIAQVSDLHNAKLGENNADLLAALESAAPDIIVITGDLIDSRNTNLQVALDFAGKALAIAPTYFVSGNHEQRMEDYPAFAQSLLEAGVQVLKNEKVILEKDGDRVVLAGIEDPYFMDRTLYGTMEYVTAGKLSQAQLDAQDYIILLAHRAELGQVYADFGVDIAFSGHAHGGQFRFPWGGGVFAPGQGFFPAYTEGTHQFGNMTLVISRGLGNSLMPFRINNRPELVIVDLTNP